MDPLKNYLLRGRTGDPDIMAGHDWPYWQRSMHWGKIAQNWEQFLAYLSLALLLIYCIGRLALLLAYGIDWLAARKKARDA